jgi:autotransporter-associated beta strand protein
MKTNRNSGAAFFASLCLALVMGGAQAQNSFWWTNNASGVWNSTANWSNENATLLAPVNGGSADYGLTFQNTSAVITTNNTATPRFLLNQLVFDSGAQVVTIYAGNGTNITFTNSTGGVLPQFVKNSANNVTNNIAFVLATNTAFVGTGAGTVLVNSNVSGTGSLLMGGNYTLVLASSNSYFGTTTITNGTLKVGNYRALGTNRTVTVSGAGTLDLNNVDLRTNYAYYVTISGAGVGNNGAIINNSGSGLVNLGLDRVTLAGDATIGGSQRWGIQSSLDLAGYRLTKVGAAQISVNSGNLTAGDIDINAGFMSFEGTGLIVTGVVGATTLNVGGSLMLYNTISNNMSRLIIANGGTLQLGTSGGGGSGTANSPIMLQSNLPLNGLANYILGGNITESGGSFAVNKIGGFDVKIFV